MAAAILLSGLATPAFAQGVVIPFGAAGYRIFTYYTSVPSAWFVDSNFDDSSWPVCSAPFSGLEGACGAIPTPGWDTFTTLIVRKHFNLSSAPAAAELRFVVAGGASFWINGVAVAGGHRFNRCPSPDTVVATLPSGLLRAGDNFVGVLTDGAVPLPQFFDFTLLSDGLTVTRRATWGELKTIYR